MRILHTADWHIGNELGSKIDPETGLNLRVCDYFRTIDEIIDYAIENSIDLFLFAGDAFQTSSPSLTLQREFAKRIKRLSEANIPFFAILGQHDISKIKLRAHTLSVYDVLDMPNVYVASKPSITTLTLKGSDIQIVAIPYIYEAHRDDFVRLLQGVLKVLTAKLNPEVPALLTLHYPIIGTETSSGFIMPTCVPISLLETYPWTYVALGDIHKYQVVSKKPLAAYSGSIERCSFNEENDEKGFVIIDIEDGKVVKNGFVKVNARILKTLDVDADIDGKGCKDAIIRLNVKNGCSLVDVEDVGKTAFHLSLNVKRVEQADIEALPDKAMSPMEAIRLYFKDLSKNDYDFLEQRAKFIL